MKKVLALILAVMMILPMTVTTFAEEDDGDWTTAPSKYTQMKVFTGTYGFGTEEMNVYTNDDFSEFYIYFWSFDSDQVLEGTVEDGICTVDFDYSGFMSGDCQLIWDDAMASEEAWTPVGAEEEVDDDDWTTAPS